jgi:hypothetical protein
VRKLISLFLIMNLLAGISVILPEVEAQSPVYDNYQWFGLTGQGTTNTNPDNTLINNQTAFQINQTGYMVTYQTYFGAGVTGTFEFKLGRATGNPLEYNVYWTDPAGMRAQVGGQTNYTGFNVAVESGDVISAYFDTGAGNVFLCQRIEAGIPAYYYMANDVSGIQTFTNTVAGRGLTMRVLIGWDNPPTNWGTYLWHGFMISGVILMTYAPIYTVKTIRDASQYEDMTVALLIGFMAFMIGLGLFWTWINYP